MKRVDASVPVHRVLLLLSTRISFATKISGASYLSTRNPDVQEAGDHGDLDTRGKDNTGSDLRGIWGLQGVARARKLGMKIQKEKKKHFLHSLPYL